MSMKEDARFVGAFVRGGSWEVGLRIARNVTVNEGQGRPSKTGKNLPVSGRVSLNDFATEAGVTRPTVMKYLAAWEWAADQELVDPANQLGPHDEYDFSKMPEDDKVDGEWVDGCWMSFYKIACENPPPWNPQGKPLEPRKYPERNVAKGQVTPTREQVVEHIKANPKVVTEVVKDPKVRLAARDAIKEHDDEVLEKLSGQKERTEAKNADASSEQLDLTVKLRRVKRDLTEILPLVRDLRGAEAQTQRVAVIADLGPLRMLIDAIESAAKGQDIDSELVKLLAEEA